MANWIGRLGKLTAAGFVLACLAPGCDDQTAQGDPSPIPADHLTDNAAQTHADGGTDVSVDAGTDADAGSTRMDGGGATNPTSANHCQADPDPNVGLLPNAQLDPDVIARAAVIIAGCSLTDDGTPRTVAELWNAHREQQNWFNLTVTQARCLANARCGCEAMEHCLGFRMESGAEPGCQLSCNGDVFRGCGAPVDLADGYAVDIDCSRVGQHCLATAGCVEDVGAICSETDPPTCGANGPLFCSNGVMRTGPDCTALGLVCVDGNCQGTGDACPSNGFVDPESVELEDVSCQGGTLGACVNGKRASFPCAEQGPGFDCQSVDGLAFCGLASECLPGDLNHYPTLSLATCDGTRLSFCNAGRLDTIDCTELGFAGCEKGPRDEYVCGPRLPL
jgi:hypothetical protein